MGETGMLFPDADENALAEAIVISEKESSHAIIAKQARAQVEARANWQKNVQLLDQAYHRLAGR